MAITTTPLDDSVELYRKLGLVEGYLISREAPEDIRAAMTEVIKAFDVDAEDDAEEEIIEEEEEEKPTRARRKPTPQPEEDDDAANGNGEEQEEEEEETPDDAEERRVEDIKATVRRMRRWLPTEDDLIRRELRKGNTNAKSILGMVNELSPDNERTESAVSQRIFRLKAEL